MTTEVFETSVFDEVPIEVTDIEGVTSFTLSLTSDFQLKGTLNILGRTTLVINDILFIGGTEYKVTNVSYSKAGDRSVSTVLLRNRSYELSFITPPVQINWVTCPEFMATAEILANIEMPTLTDLRVKFGDVFGADGWTMREVCDDVAALGGWALDYSLPDFYIKSLMLDRQTSLMSFLRGALSAFMPRIFVSDGILYVAPAVNSTEAGPEILVVESLDISDTQYEPYSTLSIRGGEGEFDLTKWEGSRLATSTDPSELEFYMNSIVGTVTSSTQESTIVYYARIADTHTISIIASVYSVDIFRNTQVLIFRQEWKFMRREPLYIATAEELETALAELSSYSLETDPPAWPVAASHMLQSCDRQVNEHLATGREWQTPLLIKTHHAIWKYLYWSDKAVSTEAGNLPVDADPSYKNPPDPTWPVAEDDSPLGFPTGYDLTVTADPVEGHIPGVVGVWSCEAFYERIDYKYQYMEGEEDGILGGLLLTRGYMAIGVIRAAYPNIRQVSPSGAVKYFKNVNEGRGQRYIPAHNASRSLELDPQIIYPPYSPIQKLSMGLEDYKQLSIRTVQKTVLKWEMDHDDNANFYDLNSSSISNTLTETQYKTEGHVELIPLRDAPQSLVRKRGMQVYKNYPGFFDGLRFVELSFPLINNWADMEFVAPHLYEITPLARSIRTVTLVTPQVLNLSLLTLGTEPSVSSPDFDPAVEFRFNTRIVAASVAYGGDGSVSSQLAVQCEMD